MARAEKNLNNNFRLAGFFLSAGLFALLWLRYDIPWYEALTLALLLFFFLDFVFALGKKVAILEFIALLAMFQWLFGAVLTYEIYNQYNDLAFLWKTFMKLPAQEYFGYVLPGTLALVLGLKFPLNWSKAPNHRALVERTKIYLQDRGHIGVWMSAIGVAIFFFVPFMPVSVRAIFNFFSQLLYVGLFYVLFSKKSKYKGLILIVVLSVTLLNSVMTGMYGELIYWSVLFVIMYLMEYPVSALKRFGIIGAAVLVILLLQSIKEEYRLETWGPDQSRKADFGFFTSLVSNRLANPTSLVEADRLFNMAVRANQGFLISNAMSYVPKHEPFARGETIWKSVLAAFVPRFLWPGKPQAGGKEKVKRFLGAPDVDYSFNISPIGEAYVNFGKTGGILFMFVYGLLFNGAFRLCLSIAQKRPSVVAWLPLLFAGALAVETDFLTTFNSLIKGAMFTWFVFWSCNVFFKVRV